MFRQMNGTKEGLMLKISELDKMDEEVGLNE